MSDIFEKELQKVMDTERVLKQEPMKKHTTFRVGGPAEYYMIPKRDEIEALIRLCNHYNIPFLIIGNGSNLLVSDRGIRGAVIEIGKEMDEIQIEGERIVVQAGALLSKTAHRAMKESLTGMEFAAGIPGCVGGAVTMNAGAYGGEIKDILSCVTILTKEGEVKKLSAKELELSYRHSIISAKEYIVLDGIH